MINQIMEIGKTGVVGTVVVVLAAAWLIIEIVFLNGQTVADQHHEIRIPFTFTVDEIGASYRITIGREKGGSGGLKRAMTYHLNGPGNSLIHSDTEEWPRHRRFFEFSSEMEGDYTLQVDNAKGRSYGNDFTWIKVEKNDRTILLRFMGFW